MPSGHADSFTTSITLHLRPEAVRRDRIVDPQHKPVDWEDPDLDFASYSSTGVIGDPTHASAELGAKLWEAVVDEVAATLRSIAEDSGPMSPVDDGQTPLPSAFQRRSQLPLLNTTPHPFGP